MKRELPELLRELPAGEQRRLAEALLPISGTSAPPQLLRERLLGAVKRPRLRYAPLYGALSELFDLRDLELSERFARAADSAAWVVAAVPGTELLHLTGGPRVAGADNGLVRIQAGARFPVHRHLGLERVLVLEGGYMDEPSGRLYRAGDLHEMQPGSSHAYTALPEQALLLAVSVVGGVEVDGLGTLSPSTSGSSS